MFIYSIHAINMYSQTFSYNYTITILIFLCSIPLLLLIFKKPKQKSTSKLPPSPWKLPIIGNLHQLGSMPHHSLQKLSSKHGPLMYLKLGSIPSIIVSSSEIAQEIFKSHDITFSARPPLYAVKKITYGYIDMVFAPYGEYWRQVRKFGMLELFSHKRVHSFRGVRQQEVKLLVDSIKRLSCIDPCAKINLSEMLLALDNNIVCRIMFGDKHGVGNYDEGRSKFHDILEETQFLLGGFCIADFFPNLAWVERFTGLKKNLEKNFGKFDAYYSQMIEEHLSKKKQEDEVEDLVDVLLRLRNDPSYENIFCTMDHIKALITDVFIAGTDTTSASLEWTMSELIKNPKVMIKMQKELNDIVGDKPNVEETDLEQLTYLKLVMKEALRLHPPTPLLVPRETIEECEIAGYTIPSKTRVYFNAMAISMDPKKWDNPEKFWPERFLNSDVDYKGQHFEFLPFGFGRRGCPGITFGVSIYEIVLANLLHCFEWKLPLGMDIEDLDMKEAFGITTHKKVPLRLVAKSRFM